MSLAGTQTGESCVVFSISESPTPNRSNQSLIKRGVCAIEF